MVSIYLYAAILTLNLSSPAREGNYGLGNTLAGYNVLHTVPPGRRNSGSTGNTGTVRLDGTPSVNSPFDTGHPPIPYYRLWNNHLVPTAQQFIAILSLLEEEGIILDGFKDDWPK